VPAVGRLADGLSLRYGWTVRSVDPVAGGADAAARSWRITTTDGRRLFVKLRPAVRPAAILLPTFLEELGVPEPVAAVPAIDGSGWIAIDGWAAVVMPLIDGPTALEAGLGLESWRRLGAFAARLHGSTPSRELRAALGVERFGLETIDQARAIDARIGALVPRELDAESSAVRNGWLARRPTIRRLIDTSAALVARIHQRDSGELAASFVPCHADLHAGNVLLGPDGAIRVVDWDECLLAPRERDLMFVRGSVVAGRVADAEADAFEAGYGPYAVDRELLAHYRAAWAVQDVAGFAWEVLFQPERRPPTRPLARRRFESQFDPGDEVDGAFEIAAEVGAG